MVNFTPDDSNEEPGDSGSDHEGRKGVMREYLVCYDYGSGGFWWWIAAPSAEAITDRYHGMHVFEEPPPWWNREEDEITVHRRLGDPDDLLLARQRR
jgi:hypothetical protein